MGLTRDFRHALRRLGASPGFAMVAILTLALGIGANVAIFSVVNAVFFVDQPFSDTDRLVRIGWLPVRGDVADEIVERSRGVFEDTASYTPLQGALRAEGRTTLAMGEVVSGNYFDVLGLLPLRGRLIGPADDHGGAVAVVSESLWRSRFVAREDIIGRSVHLNGRPVTIVGVAPPGFRGLLMPAVLQEDIWVSRGYWSAVELMRGDVGADGGGGGLLVARLRPAVRAVQATAALEVIDEVRRHLTYPVPPGRAALPLVMPLRDARLHDPLFGSVAKWIAGGLLLMAWLVVVIACANLANLVLARGATRADDLALRHALGASRLRLVRELMAENVLVAAGGVAVALAAAAALSRYVPLFVSPVLAGTTFTIVPSVDASVAAYAIGTAVITVLAFGLVPSIRTTRSRLQPSMSGPGGVSAHAAGRLLGIRHMLIVAQVSVSLVLLVASGLLLRSFVHVAAIDLGFRQEGLASIGVDLTMRGYTEDQGRTFYQRWQEEARAIGGVSAVTLTDGLPGGDLQGGVSTTVWRDLDRQERLAFASSLHVGSEFFDMFGIAIVSGRGFEGLDPAGPAVVVLDEEAARLFPGGRSPVGERIWIGDHSDAIEVVGIARRTRTGWLGDARRPQVYLPAVQHYHARMRLVASTDRDDTALVTLLERITHQLDPDVAVVQALTVRDQLASVRYPFRLAASVIGTLGLLGMLVAGIGVYGVTSFLVALRTRELGVRLAIGATPRQVLLLVIGGSMRPVAVGLGVGLMLAAPVALALERLLFEVRAFDVATFGLVAALLTSAALLACVLPARRAASVDPAMVLRAE